MNQLFNLERPVIFAHRGASAYAPENTLSSFMLALKQGALAIELDTKLTADGNVIVIHDQSLDRTTGTPGKVNHKTLSEIKLLDAGSFFSNAYVNERIPTLSEVFESVGKQLFINIELTNYLTPGDALPVRVAELVKHHSIEDWVMFSSFEPRNLLRIRRLLPGVPLGILALEGKMETFTRSFIGKWISPQCVHPFVDDVNQSFIEKCHTSGWRVHVWTVNQADQIKRLFDWGIDGIFTDDPVLANNIREKK
jgi:glycerophosphoryl diester phosphodiesterase